MPALPEMIGGSADLTGSNNTRTKSMQAMNAADFSGRFIHYGIREHGMAAAMNGMALHGGIVPYSGTFLVFSDYCRPAIRLAALMGVRGDPRHDPRLHRPRRRRPDASAGRASRRAARDPQSAGVPPGRRGRDRRMLAARLAEQGPAQRAGADAAEPAAVVAGFPRQEPLRRRRLRDRRRPTARPRCRSSPPARKSRLRSKAPKLLAAKGIAARVVSVPSLRTVGRGSRRPCAAR